jgi:Bacterial TSP3 repeat
MKTKKYCKTSLPRHTMKIFLLVTFAAIAWSARAATTIDAANRYAYGANIGWIDWRGDTNNGAVIGEYACSGYLYSANVGWINLGSGSPVNGIQYKNTSATDFGINHDGLGNLSGFAYSANAGWINFETNGAPKVDLFTGKLSGYIWSANCGWISLSNAFAYVQTDIIQQGALAPNSLPVPWLLLNFGTTNVNANVDTDGDGMSNMQEYLAGTDPNYANSVLRITSISRGSPLPASTTVNWIAVPTRFYFVQERPSMTAGGWVDYAGASTPGGSSAAFTDTTSTNDFFRVRAYRPLMP